jgi:tRNA-2-methylthio-N6-dimethylallyladenosine synthase
VDAAARAARASRTSYRLQAIDGLARIRLITLHPSYVTPRARRGDPRLRQVRPFPAAACAAGSDDVLRRMKRGYTTDLYRERVAILRERRARHRTGHRLDRRFPRRDRRGLRRD